MLILPTKAKEAMTVYHSHVTRFLEVYKAVVVNLLFPSPNIKFSPEASIPILVNSLGEIFVKP